MRIYTLLFFIILNFFNSANAFSFTPVKKEGAKYDDLISTATRLALNVKLIDARESKEFEGVNSVTVIKGYDMQSVSSHKAIYGIVNNTIALQLKSLSGFKVIDCVSCNASSVAIKNDSFSMTTGMEKNSNLAAKANEIGADAFLLWDIFFNHKLAKATIVVKLVKAKTNEILWKNSYTTDISSKIQPMFSGYDLTFGYIPDFNIFKQSGEKFQKDGKAVSETFTKHTGWLELKGGVRQKLSFIDKAYALFGFQLYLPSSLYTLTEKPVGLMGAYVGLISDFVRLADVVTIKLGGNVGIAISTDGAMVPMSIYTEFGLAENIIAQFGVNALWVKYSKKINKDGFNPNKDYSYGNSIAAMIRLGVKF